MDDFWYIEVSVIRLQPTIVDVISSNYYSDQFSKNKRVLNLYFYDMKQKKTANPHIRKWDWLKGLTTTMQNSVF